MAAWAQIELIDDRRANQFKVIVLRPALQGVDLSGGVSDLLALVSTHPGLNVAELVIRLNKPKRTIERWLQTLKDQQKIEFRGAPKTGGYHLYRHNENNGRTP